MSSEIPIAAGISVDRALNIFRESVNQPGTVFSTDHWLLPKLDQLRNLLTDPITQDEAQALLDVLHERHPMSDLIKWHECRPVSWPDFFTHREDLKKEEVRRRADERERRRAAGLDPYFDGPALVFPDDLHPKISDSCPDCGSADWKSIVYGLPTEDTEEDARRGHFILGGCVLRDAERYCTACFNSWPTKPKGSKPAGRPESIKRSVAETRSGYARLSALANQPPSPEEPTVHRAWARIDGSVGFLVSFGEERGRVTKTVQYTRIGGAPLYSPWFWANRDDYPKASDLDAVAAIRFEREHQPERHNLHNNWDIVQAHRRKHPWDEESYRRERASRCRAELSRLLKLARSSPGQLPEVVSVRSRDKEKEFRVRFPWGDAQVRRYRFSPLDPLDYSCNTDCANADNSELARDLARAAALLAEFPGLATGARPFPPTVH